MNSIDLHGIKHRDAASIIDSFISQNKDNLPIEVITGNSIDMQSILRKVVNNYNLKMEPTTYVNLGSYVITNK